MKTVMADHPRGRARPLSPQTSGQPNRAGSGVRPVPMSAGLEARLSITEILLSSDDTTVCATEALEWLVRHTSVRRCICAVVDADLASCTMIASIGLPFEVSSRGFSFSLDRAEDPLASALAQGEPVFFANGRAHPKSSFGSGATTVVPLRARSLEQELAVGVLLIEGEDACSPKVDVLWLAGLLAEKLVRLRQRRSVAERGYARERSLLYTILNAVVDPILLTDLDGRLIVANARAERLFMMRDEESEGRRRAITMNNMLFSAALSSLVFDDADSSRSELLLVDPTEGSDLLFELMAHVVKDPGEGTSVVSILRNVTDLGRAAMEIESANRKLRMAEADVNAQRHRLELIIGSVADPIVVTDPAGEIVLMNEPAEKILALPDEAPDEWLRWVRGNEAHFSSFVSNLLFRGDRRHRGEIHLVDGRTGEPLPVEAVAGKILSDQGELNGVVTILHDRREAIERVRLYEQLKLASEELERKVQEATAELAHQNELLRRQAFELERASAAKSQFLANMSHELRTPLNAILGYTSMMLQGVSGELAPAQRQKLQRIEANGKNLLAIINEILDITRIEAGRMPLNLSEFTVADVVDEVVGELEAMVRSKLAMRVQLEPGLGRALSDRQKVKQIVLNLLSNAIKFTHEGEVRVVAGPRGRLVTISVIDTGIGIAPEHHERIFEDFQQVDSSSTRAYGGTGLGLAICRRLARMLGGEISLESEIGRGSTFTLTIPRRVRRR